MTKLKELEKRLDDEPENLGLRVLVAGALIEAGRRVEGVELYRSVAIAYRDHGRPQQAITVCRRILELSPEDAACQALLEVLTAAPPPRWTPQRMQPPAEEPEEAEGSLRQSATDLTPLPLPLPYHVANPTSISQPKLSRAELLGDENVTVPEIEGIVKAARQISASLIAASRQNPEDDISVELDTRRLRRIDTGLDPGEATPVSDDPPTLDRDEDEVTFPPRDDAVPRHVVDEEKTEPRPLPTRSRPPSIAPPTKATGPLASALFAPVPPHNRAAVLQRFRRRLAAIGTTVIRRGEAGHGLVLVVRGQLDVHAERADGARVSLEAVGPGEYIGEIGLLAGAPADAYVVAATDAELLVLAANDFYEVARAFPALRAALEAGAERRLRDHAQLLRG